MKWTAFLALLLLAGSAFAEVVGDPGYTDRVLTVAATPASGTVLPLRFDRETRLQRLGCICIGGLTCNSVTVVFDKCNADRSGCSSIGGLLLTLNNNTNSVEQVLSGPSIVSAQTWGQFRITGGIAFANTLACYAGPL